MIEEEEEEEAVNFFRKYDSAFWDFGWAVSFCSQLRKVCELENIYEWYEKGKEGE